MMNQLKPDQMDIESIIKDLEKKGWWLDNHFYRNNKKFLVAFAENVSNNKTHFDITELEFAYNMGVQIGDKSQCNEIIDVIIKARELNDLINWD